MKIILSDEKNLFEQQLRNYIYSISHPILFDITFDGLSERILTLSEGGKYALSYSRPFFFNIFKPPLAEFEFIFSLEKVKTEGNIIVTGKIKLKKYIIGAILFVCLILLYNTYNVIYQEAPFRWISFIVMPLVLSVYLIIEYWVFRKKVKNFLISIAD
jgi:hypothetical protein